MYRSVILLAFLAGALAVDYSGYKVLRVTPNNEESLSFLRSLGDTFDIWKESRGIGTSTDILVSTEERPLLISRLGEFNIEVKTMIEDVQGLIDEQMKPSALIGGFDYDSYHPIDEIDAWIDDFVADNAMAAEAHVTFTFEGRDVRKVRLSSDLSDTTRPIIYIVGGTHSREWVSPATMMYVAKTLVDEYNPIKNDNLLDIIEYQIIPSHNQDGYAHTWDSNGDRMWRKTRSSPNQVCVGVDPNRNYDSHWGEGGSSTVKCSDTYMGPTPGSEIEIAGIQNDVMAISSRVKIFMDVHAYSQYWMYPYGYTKVLPSDSADLDAATAVAVNALTAVHGTDYEYGSIARVIYVASGSSADWAYEVAGVKHSYALEMRDKGTFGFLLPANQIQPTAEEFHAGVDALVRHLQSNGEL